MYLFYINKEFFFLCFFFFFFFLGGGGGGVVKKGLGFLGGLKKNKTSFLSIPFLPSILLPLPDLLQCFYPIPHNTTQRIYTAYPRDFHREKSKKKVFTILPIFVLCFKIHAGLHNRPRVSGWLRGYLSGLQPLRAGVQFWPRPACGLSFSRSQPDSRVFLRFSSLIKIDSQLINI